MKFVESGEFGEVILTINGAEYYLAEWVRDREEWNERCEEYCALAELCHNTLCHRKFCDPFQPGPEHIFITKEPEKLDIE